MAHKEQNLHKRRYHKKLPVGEACPVDLLADNYWMELPQLQDTTGKVQNVVVVRWNWRKVAAWAITMCFVGYSWLLFRARSVEQIVAMTRSLVDLSPPAWLMSYVANLVVFSLPLVLMELWQLRRQNQLAPLTLRPWPRAILQGVLLLAIILFWERNEVPFIYFQF